MSQPAENITPTATGEAPALPLKLRVARAEIVAAQAVRHPLASMTALPGIVSALYALLGEAAERIEVLEGRANGK